MILHHYLPVQNGRERLMIIYVLLLQVQGRSGRWLKKQVKTTQRSLFLVRLKPAGCLQYTKSVISDFVPTRPFQR